MKTNNLKKALAYLKREFSIIPCNGQKKPIIKTWAEYQQRQPTETEVTEWWSKTPYANIGIVTGKISGLTVVDCDSHDAWDKLQKYLPDSFLAPIVNTPSGNHQMYFQYVAGLHSQNGIMEKMDIKTDGGYVIAPPSWCEYRKN